MRCPCFGIWNFATSVYGQILDLHLISVTEQYAQFAVAGPNARRLLEKLIDPNEDISNDTFPFMACGKISICGGVKARLFRISFSGELAFEIAIPAVTVIR